MDANQKNETIAFALEQAKRIGYAVVTVKDGWVFIFSKATLEILLEKSQGSETVAVQVKSSEKMTSSNSN